MIKIYGMPGQLILPRLILILLLCIGLLMVGCVDEQPDDTTNGTVSPLNIYTFVMDSQINDPNAWTHDTPYDLEQLNLGKPVLCIPVQGTGIRNINLYFEFDGIIEVISEGGDAQLSVGKDARLWDYKSYDDRTFGYTMRINDRGYVSVCPLGSSIGYMAFEDRVLGLNPDVELITGYVGREYILQVNAYRGDKIESPVVTAEIKLVQLEDTTYMGEFTVPDETISRFYSIELISYEMSETYAMELAS